MGITDKETEFKVPSLRERLAREAEPVPIEVKDSESN